MHTSSNASGCGGSKLYVQYRTNVQHRGACLSGVGGQPLLSTLNECRGALYRDKLSMDGSRAHSGYLSLHSVTVTELSVTIYVPSMLQLGVWDMAK